MKKGSITRVDGLIVRLARRESGFRPYTSHLAQTIVSLAELKILTAGIHFVWRLFTSRVRNLAPGSDSFIINRRGSKS